MYSTINWKHIFILTLAIALSSCQATRKTLNLATTVEIQLTAKNNINPDYDQRPSPIVIRVLELADDRQFGREDFLNLYENAEARLGRDLINATILKELTPEESRVEEFELSPQVKYVGLLAEFVQYEDANAILVLPIIEHKKNSFVVNVDSTSISLAQ